MIDYKIICGSIAAALTFVAHIPYIVTILRGTNKPHMFTWIIWTLLTFIVLAAQIVGGAGPGAWSTAAVLLPCLVITALSITRGEKNITRADWAMFIAGIAAIPVWILTSNPLWAVVIVVAIDALAFGPTFRKSWDKPFEENSTMYGVNIIRHSFSIAAIALYTTVTALYPIMLLVMNTSMWLMLMARRTLEPQP
jgi:exosortase/archaeosortase